MSMSRWVVVPLVVTLAAARQVFWTSMVGTPSATAVNSWDPRKIGTKGNDMVAILRVAYWTDGRHADPAPTPPTLSDSVQKSDEHYVRSCRLVCGRRNVSHCLTAARCPPP